MAVEKNEVLSSGEHIKGGEEIVDFSEYEAFCNLFNHGSRKNGILSPDLYKEVVDDPKTDFIAVNGHRLPSLIPIDKGMTMGYNEENCRKFAPSNYENIKILALPVQELDESGENQLVDAICSETDSSDGLALYFSDTRDLNEKAGSYGEEATNLRTIFNERGVNFSEIPIADHLACKLGGDKLASLCLCSARLSCREDQKPKDINIHDALSYYEKHIGPIYSRDGKIMTKLCLGDELSPQATNEFWGLYNNRFDDLGNNHPISMQDDKEDFLNLLHSEHTLVGATYEKDNTKQYQLACFTYFVDNTAMLYWLNKGYLDNKFQEISKGRDGLNLFIPGMVSSEKSKGKSYSLTALKLLTKVADEIETDVNIMYENTNRSKGYIPKIVDFALKRGCQNLDVSKTKIEDEFLYRLFTFHS